MQYIEQVIGGVDGSEARLFGYVADNSPSMDPARRRGSVLVVPGGGYAVTSDREAEPVALRFLAAGFNAFVLRYSVAPSRYPVALLELAEAMRMIRGHGDEWHVDPESVAVLGFSAGGHLAASLAVGVGADVLREAGYDYANVRPDALLLGYPVVFSSGVHAHRGSFSALLGADANDVDNLGRQSIIQYVDADMSPVFVWHTMTDTSVPVENTLALIAACRQAGVSVEAHLYPEGPHGLSLGDWETSGRGRYAKIVPCVQSWPGLAVDWLRRTLPARSC